MNRSLILAAFAALSLTAGVAMAQDGPSGPARDYQAKKTLQWLSQRSSTGIDAGSSDVVPMRSIHVTPVPVGVPGGGNG
jgi:hypothetical protein